MTGSFKGDDGALDGPAVDPAGALSAGLAYAAGLVDGSALPLPAKSTPQRYSPSSLPRSPFVAGNTMRATSAVRRRVGNLRATMKTNQAPAAPAAPCASIGRTHSIATLAGGAQVPQVTTMVAAASSVAVVDGPNHTKVVHSAVKTAAAVLRRASAAPSALRHHPSPEVVPGFTGAFPSYMVRNWIV